MKHIQLQTVETSNSTDSPDLASTQRWMIAAITAPGGLPEGLAQALKAYNQTIEDVIIAPPGISPHSRLDIYAQGYWLRLFACLKADYPSLQRLLGEPLFEFFARAYLTNHPSRSFSLYDLGDGFSRFLRDSQSASVKSVDDGELYFPLELAQIEQAIAASLRATGIENNDFKTADPFNLLLGGNIEIVLPATTHLVIAHHPLSAFQTLLDGNTLTEPPETGISYICIKRHHYHVSCQEVTDWQFYSLLSAKAKTRTLLECATAAARRTHRPIHEILAQLSLWLPTAQAGSFIKLNSKNITLNPHGNE